MQRSFAADDESTSSKQTTSDSIFQHDSYDRIVSKVCILEWVFSLSSLANCTNYLIALGKNIEALSYLQLTTILFCVIYLEVTRIIRTCDGRLDSILVMCYSSPLTPDDPLFEIFFPFTLDKPLRKQFGCLNIKSQKSFSPFYII